MGLAASTTSRTTLLLVEEDVVLRLGLGQYLRACGYQVIEAASAVEAHTLLEQGPPVAIMLIDAQLAGEGGGFALSKWTRKNRPATKVVLTAGFAGKAEAAAKLCESNSSVPYSLDELKARIAAMRARQKIPKPLRDRRSVKGGNSDTKAS